MFSKTLLKLKINLVYCIYKIQGWLFIWARDPPGVMKEEYNFSVVNKYAESSDVNLSTIGQKWNAFISKDTKLAQPEWF